MLRPSLSRFVQILAVLAMAIALPGVEIGHGLAHEHEHDSHQAASHDDGQERSAVEHLSVHSHDRVSEALRNRGDISSFITLAAPVEFAEPASFVEVLPPAFTLLFSESRATGPPPRVRAPPID